MVVHLRIEKLKTMKEQQNFQYRIYDSMGRRTGIIYSAANMREAMIAFKEDKENYSKYYYGKLRRDYNRGYHISESK